MNPCLKLQAALDKCDSKKDVNPYYSPPKRGRPSKEAIERRKKYYEHWKQYEKEHGGVWYCIRGVYLYSFFLTALRTANEQTEQMVKVVDGKIKFKYTPRIIEGVGWIEIGSDGQ
jgi:hypothetical protein